MTPAPTLTRPALSGHLSITAASDARGGTVLAHQSFRAPFHISKPYWDGRVLQVQVVNPTAGILEGDRLEMAVEVESGAALLVTTPAATRAFMMRSGAALCEQKFVVRSGGWLEYAPEPLFPHQDAHYVQRTRLDVESGAEAVFCDALAPGRVGKGERWAWRRLCLTLDVWYAGEPVLRERFDGDGATLGAMARFHGTDGAFFGNLVVISERIPGDDPVWAQVRDLHAGGGGAGRWVGLTALRRGGWIIRVVARSGQELRDTLAAVRAALATRLPELASDLRKI